MNICTARADRNDDVRSTCYHAVELYNLLDIDIDLTIDGHMIEVRRGMHPYNFEQGYARAVRRAAAGKTMDI